MVGGEGGDVPIGIAALERSQDPSWSLRIVEGSRARRSRSVMAFEGAGAARMAGAKARARERTFEKSMFGCGGLLLLEVEEDGRYALEEKVEQVLYPTLVYPL